jgi:hypothetical protein
MNRWWSLSLILFTTTLAHGGTLRWDYPEGSVQRLGEFFVFIRSAGGEYDWDTPVWAEPRNIRDVDGCRLFSYRPHGRYYIRMKAASANDTDKETHWSKESNEATVDWAGDPTCPGVAVPTPKPSPPSQPQPPSLGALPPPHLPLAQPPAIRLPSTPPLPAHAVGRRGGLLTEDCRYTGTCPGVPKLPPLMMPARPCASSTGILTESPLWKGHPCD